MEAKSYFNNFWVNIGEIKNKLGHPGDRIITLDVPQGCFMEFWLQS